MIGNLTAKQIILIILGLLILFWFISWLFSRNKKKPIVVNQAPVPAPNIYNTNTNTNVPVPIFNQDNQPYVLHYFYSPRCPHCQKFDPAWKQVVKSLKQNGFNNITFREIDITKPENENLVFYYNINTVPTVILVTPSQNLEYSGNRVPDDLYNFVVSNVNKL